MDANATPRPAPTAERAAHMMRGLEWLMIPIVLALGFMLASFAARNSDLWMHLATGRLIVDGKYSFGTDPYSFASGGRTWVNHAWLYDVLMWKVYNLSADHSVLVYLKAALVAVMALVMLLTCRPAPGQAIIPGTKANPTGWLSAALIGVGLLAIAPQMLLRSTLISFLFTAVTLYSLHHSSRWPARALPITIGVLFALWANLDQWFLIGPALVLLYLLGEFVQPMLTGATGNEPGRVRILALTLGVGLVACLFNPHHVRVFTTLPTELHANIPAAVRSERMWRLTLMHTWDMVFRRNPEFGNSVPGYSYVALIVAGLASFALNFPRLRAAHVLVWLACLALSLYSWLLIPFFAVVAAPIAVLNLHAFFAALPYRKNVIFGPVTPPAAATGDAPALAAQEGWWPGASEAAPAVTPAIAEAPPQPMPRAGRGEMTVTPETMLDLAGVMGRLLTIVVGLFTLALAYPGWLHAKPLNPIHPRRLSWEVSPEPAYVQVAERLQEMHKTGQLPADAHGLSLSFEIVDYLTFYAPDVRTFLDRRLTLLGPLAGDFVQLQRGLADYAALKEEPREFAPTMRKLGIRYVMLDPEAEGFRLLARMLTDGSQWSLWFQNGRTAIFGWHDPEQPPSSDPLRLDLVDLAFGAKVQRVPPGDTFGVTREPPPDAPAENSLLDRFLSPPPREAPLETMTSALYTALRDQAYLQAEMATEPILVNALHAAGVGRFAMPNYYTPFSNNIPPDFVVRLIRQFARRHPLPTAVQVLAVREARRGALAHPNEPLPYLMLGRAYLTLPPIGAELHPLQQAVAMHQAIDRLKPEEIFGQRGRTVTATLITLFQHHARRQEWDIAEEMLGRAVGMANEYPSIDWSDADTDQERERLGRMYEQLTTTMLAQKNKYQLDRDQAKQRNATLLQQVGLALKYGLAREALRLVEDPAQKPDLAVLHTVVPLYLWLGRIEEVQRIINTVPEQFREQFAPYQLHVWYAAGEYALAGKRLDEVIAAASREDDVKQKVADMALVLQGCHFVCAEPAAQAVRLGMIPWALDEVADATGQQPRNRLGLGLFQFRFLSERARKAEWLAMRGMLALEEGDIPKARQCFGDATKLIDNARQILSDPARLNRFFIASLNAVHYRDVLENVNSR